MRIDSNSLLNANLEPARPNKNASANLHGTGSSAQGSDSASLSVDNARVQALEAEVSRYPDVRKDRVEALQQSIASGNFRVDAPKIADTLMTELFR
jgi:flagellar biosynthesis anti-sigma factor FlgM